MTFVHQKAIKRSRSRKFSGSTSNPENFKATHRHSRRGHRSQHDSGNDVWKMFFNGASRTGPTSKIIVGVGVVFLSPRNHVLPHAFLLMESCSNNVAEYNALLIGLQLAQQMGMWNREAYGDSKLIISQVKGEYEVRHEDPICYHHAAIKLANSFDGFYISHISRPWIQRQMF